MSFEVNLNNDVVDDIWHGRKVVGTSAVQVMPDNMPKAIKGVQLKAASTNADLVYVGKAGVTAATAVDTDGFELAASEGLFIPIKDVSKVYAIAGAVSQDLLWMLV